MDDAFETEGMTPGLLVCGPSTKERVGSVLALWRGDVSVMNHVALQTAIAGKLLDRDWNRIDSDLSRLELKRVNVDVVAKEIQDIYGRHCAA